MLYPHDVLCAQRGGTEYAHHRHIHGSIPTMAYMASQRSQWRAPELVPAMAAVWVASLALE